MTTYTKATNFATKDALLTGNPSKVVKGTEIDAEFTAIQAADATSLKSGASSAGLAFLQSGTGATSRTVQSKLQDTVSVKDFGATGDGATDDTAAINACLTAAKLGAKKVFFPAGRYMITQVVIPGGLEVFGVSIGYFGNTLADDNSVLWQVDGVNKDAVVFTTRVDGPYYRIDPTYIHDLVIKKANSPADTIGNGISFSDASGNHALVSVMQIDRVQIRGFPENGLYAKQGCDPCYLNGVDTLMNGGYGFKIESEQAAGIITFNNCAGDGNKGGAAIYISALPSNNSFYINNLYSEGRNDNPYGNTTSFSYAQPWAVEIGDCNPNAVVMINGIESHCTYSTVAPDAAIYLNNATAGKQAYVTWRGVKVEQPGTLSGNSYAFKESETSKTVGYSFTDGCWANYKFIGIDKDNGRLGVGTAAPAAVAHSHVKTASASRANSNWYSTKDHTSGYFDVGLLTGSSTGDWFTFSDASETAFGAETNKIAAIYANNVGQLYANPTLLAVYPGGDNARSLGTASRRWSVVYAGTGTINTSDARDKQQVRSLSTKERDTAVSLKQLIRAFKFNDAVEAKGDKARIHFGVLAQDVKSAFEANGLHAEDYAILCYDEWAETPEIKDAEGNVTQEFREAGNRYGVRYDELLAFIIAVM